MSTTTISKPDSKKAFDRIRIETIPHELQRYETIGDWFFEREADLKAGRLVDVLVIRVSDLGDWRYNFLVAFHELAEVAQCTHDGITQADVDAFDKAFEAHRKDDDDSEPGDSPRAPYRRQHCVATGLERVLAAALGVDWSTYEEAINKL